MVMLGKIFIEKSVPDCKDTEKLEMRNQKLSIEITALRVITDEVGINLQDLQDLTSSTLLHLGNTQASLALLSTSVAPASEASRRIKIYSEA